MPPPLWESLALGAIQGLTDFLPVSSEGHLALAEILFDLSSHGLPLTVLLHVGTALATVVVLWPQVKALLGASTAGLADPQLFSTEPAARDALVVLVASVPTALIGFFLRRGVERWTSSPLAIGLGLLATCGLLVLSRFAKPGRDEQPGLVGALLIGIAQGVAVLPGVSRSASTIALALLLGVRPERAVELSLLVSLPAVLGATLLEAPRLVGTGLLLPAIAGAVMAFAVGLVGVRLLRRLVLAGRFSWFVLWLAPVAVATLALAKAWPHS